MELNGMLALALEAALKAGETIMRVYEHQELDVQLKSDKSPVTRADIESSAIIHIILGKSNLPVLTEEDQIPEYSIRKNWSTYWLVDPLDGTKEFIKRNGEFTVNIALIHHKTPVLGIVLIPSRKQIYFANKGSGAYCSEVVSFSSEPQNVLDVARKIYPVKNEYPVIVSSRSHMSSETSGFINRFSGKYGNYEKLNVGSTIKLCYLAEGRADIYPRYGTTMEWDTAAGQVIAGESGISLFSGPGKVLEYNKPDLRNPSFVAYNPSDYDLGILF